MKIKLNREKELETILTISVGLAVAYLVTKAQGKEIKVLLTLSIVFGLIGMFSNFLTAKIAWLWTKLSEVMGAVSSKVILSLVFFLFLLPIALLSRLVGKKDNLQLKKPEVGSNYFARNHKFGAKDLENSW